LSFAILLIAAQMAISFQRGTSLLLASKPERLTEEVSKEFRSVLDIGPTRTLQQDVEFGVLQIVDIAL
jgi:uncharacterized membrane protein